MYSSESVTRRTDPSQTVDEAVVNPNVVCSEFAHSEAIEAPGNDESYLETAAVSQQFQVLNNKLFHNYYLYFEMFRIFVHVSLLNQIYSLVLLLL